MDLSLVPLDDLLSALEARFDYLIFAAAQDQGPIKEHAQRWKGHVVFCQGMATDLIRDMQTWARREDDDDEDGA